MTAAVVRRAWSLAAVALGVTQFACSGAATPSQTPAPRPATNVANGATRRPNTDTLPGLVPPGFGTLKQEDLSLRLRSSNLQVRAVPLDESIIRLMSPDSYRALSELKRSKNDAIASVARRIGSRELSLWYVSFFAIERGETRFSPREFIITNVGRDFRPLEVIPLTPRFGEQRLRQNERQDAIYAFDGQIDVHQPLAVAYETARNDDWADLLPQIERERALVKSRAAAGRTP